MPNDAKLGLLVGVLGVIVVAAMSGKTAPALGTTATTPLPAPPQASAPVKGDAKPSAAVKAAAELPAGPK